MGFELDLKSLEQAFNGRPDLIGAIRNAAGMCKLDTTALGKPDSACSDFQILTSFNF